MKRTGKPKESKMKKEELETSRNRPCRADRTGGRTGAGVNKVEEQIKLLIEKAKKKGYITYEEMNEQLPDEAISPNRLDSLLMSLDEMGINIIDEADVEKAIRRRGFRAFG